ncbi:uncharacterized protein LOC141613345 [Silene latifolia]|uniref:uncharacterized protein LOC141613345 n=1 Tax=Silene latifolia TaxID=37657 RepID=UPI003D782C3C
MWSLVDDFHRVVETHWKKPVKGNPMFQVTQKLKSLKYCLKQLDRHNFSDIENITHVTEVALEGFQNQLRLDPLNQELCTAENACAQELRLLKSTCAQYLQQKSKEKWMDEGDSNSAFFHASIKHRRMKNRVYLIKNMHGVLCTHQTEIQGAFEEYYVTLLGTSKPVVPVNMDVVRQGACLTSEHQDILQAPVNEDEIKTTLFSIPGNKAPGPDGYSSQFFKDAWSIICKDVIAAVKNVCSTGKLLKACNATVFTLIPKVDVPEHVTQFRLSTILQDIISPSQSAFIKGRDIVGNVLICQDLIRLYRRKACSPRKRTDFRYHPLCKRVQLSHLCFADDLVMFCRGDVPSVILMLRAFKTFSLASGLLMNQGKSEIYCNGVDKHTMSMMVRISGMYSGKIPFKYLGVNISPKRLGVND